MTVVTNTLHDRVMMLSVHPRHVANILCGSKTVELRRTRPDVQPGQPVAIYATVPSAAVVATCRIARVQIATPETVWRTAGSATAVTETEFANYFAGAASAVALHLSDVRALENAVPLAHMRDQAEFHPPQTWHFLDRQRIQDLFADHPSSSALTTLIHAVAD